MSTNRRGKTTNKEDGSIVNMLTQPPLGNQLSQGDTSSNLSIDKEQSRVGQGDPSKDPGIESTISNQGNSAKAKSSGENQDQRDPPTMDPGNNQPQSHSQGTSVKEFEKVPIKEPLSVGDSIEGSLDKNEMLKDKEQDKSLVNPNYLSILGDKPPQEKHGIIISINSDEEGEFTDNVDLTNKDAVFAKAMELSVKGNGLEAAKYLNIYKTLGNLPINRPSNKRATSANPVLSVENKDIPEGAVFENGMWFFPGRTSAYTKRNYTPYFDKNIDELKYPIPLTIFNKDWQTKAMTCHIKKKAKSNDGEKSDSSYSGLPYADEWLLDYGDWSIYYNAFVSAVSKYPLFAKWAIAHKMNVEKVYSEMGWLTALKYDMRVREFALVNRVEIGDKTGPPDFSNYDRVLAEECFGQSRLRDKTHFRKNPYVEGGERDGWDPSTGKPPAKKSFEKNNQSKDKPYQKWNKRSEETPVASGSGSYNQKEKFKFKHGYNGNNFDPNFAEKKAAAAAAAKNVSNK